MNPNIAITDKDRAGVVKILNALLADEYVLYTKTRIRQLRADNDAAASKYHDAGTIPHRHDGKAREDGVDAPRLPGRKSPRPLALERAPLFDRRLHRRN